MFEINDDLSIYLTRGDTAVFNVDALNDAGEKYTFRKNDMIRFKVTEKKACESVMLQKDVIVEEDTDTIEIYLSEEDTKIGEVISKPTDFWYEVELNPLTNPQTIIGYDEEGAKILKLFPEGDNKSSDVQPEDIPVVDTELDVSSDRPVQNQAIARALLEKQEEIDRLTEELDVERKRIDDIISTINKD